jgi:dTDP-4-amino-4,6-dideoxygalactose transaminase
MRSSRYNYPHQFENLPGLLADLQRLLCSGNYVQAEEVRSFEAAFARYCTVAHARGVNSGTDALIIAMRALGVRSEDEVIAQANTFHATVAAIEPAGARPVLVDARADTYLIDSSQVSSAITTRTRVLMPVHLYGKPTPMQELLSIARTKKPPGDRRRCAGARSESRWTAGRVFRRCRVL